MARPLRIDTPGRWHHVMNRGLAHRTVFETRRDVRAFLACLARAAHERRIEVHAYCLLTTHYHLLVRSVDGDLSETMRRIQNDFVRWFNRSRGRDGALFRGRFCSRHVDTLTYQYAVVSYIDQNPVQAGLAKRAEQFPHGSAFHYSRPRGPPWLSRNWLEGAATEFAGTSSYEPWSYPHFFDSEGFDRLRPIVERRLAGRIGGKDQLDDLLQATPDRVLEWMRRQTKLGDGTEIGAKVFGAPTLRAAIALRRFRSPEQLLSRGQAVDLWEQVEVGLLRDLCKLTLREIGSLTGRCESRAGRIWRRHRLHLESDPDYASAVTRLTAELTAGSGAVRAV